MRRAKNITPFKLDLATMGFGIVLFLIGIFLTADLLLLFIKYVVGFLFLITGLLIITRARRR